MTTKTNKTARKSHRIDRNRDIAAKKINALKFVQAEPLYDLHIDFNLADWQDFQIVDEWIDTKDAAYLTGLSNKIMEEMHFGSGTCFLTGMRDLHFRGTEKALTDLLRGIRDHGEFRIHKLSLYLVQENYTEEDELREKIQAFYKAKDRRFRKISVKVNR